VLELPLGTIVTRESDNSSVELLTDGQEILLLKGGAGGFGNEHFKSSSNQQPMEATKGKLGDSGVFTAELRIIADVGLVGLPNAGKTSLLNALTNAGARVGEYPFTTLDPNLGVYHGIILADIPGLIEGASEGKGLGHKFLKHISRTKLILHCISLERDNMYEAYTTVRNELGAYENTTAIPELILFTKKDMCREEDVSARVKEFEHLSGRPVFGVITVLDDVVMKEFSDSLMHALKHA
jgi:GTP-binding protein